MNNKELENIITNVMKTLMEDLAIPLGKAIGRAVSDAYTQGYMDGAGLNSNAMEAEKSQRMIVGEAKEAILPYLFVGVDIGKEGEDKTVIIRKEAEK